MNWGSQTPPPLDRNKKMHDTHLPLTGEKMPPHHHHIIVHQKYSWFAKLQHKVTFCKLYGKEGTKNTLEKYGLPKSWKLFSLGAIQISHNHLYKGQRGI